jgi:DNA-binding transcriptional MerR regulator
MRESMNGHESIASSDDSEVWLNIAHLPTTPLPKAPPDYPLPIADMANFFGVTHRTLHFYEEKRLLQPERNGSMRVYPPDQVRLMALINLCRETGMAIAQIRELLAELAESASGEESETIFRHALKARRSELVAEESLIRRQMQQIVEALVTLDDEGGDATNNDNRLQRPPFMNELEYQCLRLMAEGYMPVRIANSLDMALEQVMIMETTIIRKFGASNRFHAVAKAVLLGIIVE